MKLLRRGNKHLQHGDRLCVEVTADFATQRVPVASLQTAQELLQAAIVLHDIRAVRRARRPHRSKIRSCFGANNGGG
jgi:hypothetical protein